MQNKSNIQTEDEYSLKLFFQQLHKWKKQLLITILSIFVISALVSLLLPNYYKSETIFYAASPDLAKPIPIGNLDKDVRIYGDDSDLDRLFTISMSNELLTFIIDSFDLYSHYDIDKSGVKAKFKVREKFLENYQTIKTKYGALQLIIEDKDPKISADLANTTRWKIDQLAQIIVKESQAKLIKTYKSNIALKKAQSDSLNIKLLKRKEEYGIFDARNQANIYTNILTKAISDLEEAKAKIIFYKKYPSYRDSLMKYMAEETSNEGIISQAQGQLEKFSPVMSEIISMEGEQGRVLDQISLDKERLKQLDASFLAPFSALHIVERAEVPVQKSRPKRSIIVLLVTLTATVLCFLSVFIIENIMVDNSKSNV